MRKLWLLSLFCALAGACTSSSGPSFEEPAPSAAPASQEAPAAQVGPVKITRQQLDDRLALLSPEDQEYAKTPSGRKNFLQLLVREKLIALDAKDKELDRSDVYLSDLEDKQQQLKEIYQDYSQQLLVHMWEEYNREKGLTRVSDEEIEAYYKKYPYEMKIRQIIIADAQTADAVWRELKRAKSRWKELERQYSDAPQESKGKEISFMPGEFIPELEVIAANSPAGSVQGFVKTAQGFHIIMKTGERRLSLKDAAPRIRTILENHKTDAALNALQNKYKVMIYEQDE
ncbi:peptidylprolyl isomerase [Candidatus Avelusimicrobium facis]|mgnify:FL=1|uniref:peptidylprolyl isomerase n=1 Tax=Candidatus Avelusimicrobium facis TaxID=3416203 RepID=UPI0015B534BB